MKSQKRIFNFLIISMLMMFLCCLFVEVNAATNGIGTVNETYSRTIVPGATYTYTESDNGSPQKHYVFEYDPKTAGVDALAVYGEYAFGGDTLSTNIALAESRGYTVIAGVNGSPFDTSNGTTTGTLISEGRIISAKSGESGYDSFAIKSDGTMFIGTSNLTFKYTTSSNKEIKVNTINKQKKTADNNVYLYTNDYSTDTTSLAASTEVILSIVSGEVAIGKKLVCKVDEIKNGVTRTSVPKGKVALVGSSIEALGNISVGEELNFDFINNDSTNDWNNVRQSINGFYEILKDGEYVNVADPAVHPRTTIGFKADGSIVLYVVDGRQPTFSIGLTDMACAQYMKSLGCVAAIRMDGGGSSTMALRMPGENKLTTVNSPSDGGERRDADGLLIVLKQDYNQNVGEETLLHAYPNNVSLLENTVLDIKVLATDERYNAKDTPEYKMEVIGDCGQITADGKFQAKQGAGSGKVKISSGKSETFVDVKVTDKVDELYATVNNLALSPNEKVNISVKAYYDSGLLVCSNESFTWTCSEGIGTINQKGEFVATGNAGVSGNITVSHGNTSFKILVTVGQLPKEITGFENDVCGNGAGQWRNNQVNEGSGSCAINSDLRYVRYGNKSLKIEFNLANTTATCGTQISTGSSLLISGTPTAIGMWVYATPSAKGAWIRLQYQQTGSTGAMYADFGEIDWEGWKYLEAPIDQSVTYPISVRYLVRVMAVNPSQRINGVIYVDQLRAVYGFSNDDFDAPVISNATPDDNTLCGVTTQTISFDAIDAMSGVKKEATEFYLDNKKIDNLLFKEIKDGYTVSWTPSSLIPLTEGTHKVKARVEDNYGNYVIKEWKIFVDTKLPKFEFAYESEIALGKDVTIELKANNSLFRNVDFEMKYDVNNVEVYDVIPLGKFKILEETFDENNGILKVKVQNTTYLEEETSVLKIEFKAKNEEVKFEFSDFDIVYSNRPVAKASQEVNDVQLKAVNKFNYEEFEKLINSINQDNVLLSVNEIREAMKLVNELTEEQYKEYEEIINVLLNALMKYETIVQYLNNVDSSSKQIGIVIGG